MNRIILMLATAAMLWSCDQEPFIPETPAAGQARLSELYDEIQTTIADKSCKRNGQCKVMAYGAKACGGPVGYLVYSSGNVDEKALQALVDEYTALQETMNDEFGLISDCSVPTPPDVSCVSGNCE